MENTAVEKLMAVIQRFRSSDTPLGAVLLFLGVASEPERNQAFYAKKYKLPRSSVSRYVNQLSKPSSQNKKALGLLIQAESPGNDREKLLLLTVRGAALLADIHRELRQ